MSFTDEDLEVLKSAFGIYKDPLELGNYQIKLFALINRLEKAEKMAVYMTGLLNNWYSKNEGDWRNLKDFYESWRKSCGK